MPYLTNSEICALSDTCCACRPLKHTEFMFRLSPSKSLQYATNAVFRERVHEVAHFSSSSGGCRKARTASLALSVKQGAEGRSRNIAVIISRNNSITDVSTLSEFSELACIGCEGIRDVSALSSLEKLTLSGCKNVTDASALRGVRQLSLSCCEGIRDVSALGAVDDHDLASC